MQPPVHIFVFFAFFEQFCSFLTSSLKDTVAQKAPITFRLESSQINAAAQRGQLAFEIKKPSDFASTRHQTLNILKNPDRFCGIKSKIQKKDFRPPSKKIRLIAEADFLIFLERYKNLFFEFKLVDRPPFVRIYAGNNLKYSGVDGGLKGDFQDASIL